MGASSSYHLAHEFGVLETVETITPHDVIKGKNFEYYSGKRFTIIPPSFYKKYTRGYLWGFYESVE